LDKQNSGEAGATDAPKLVIMTDPARELADLCQSLYANQNAHKGADYLSDKFDVQPWSRDFYLVIFAILDRMKMVEALIDELGLDEDHKDEAVNHIRALAQAFDSGSMMRSWYDNGSTHLAPVNVQPLKMLSGMVRQRISYPKLAAEDVTLSLGEVDTLLEWLYEHQLAEHDFIRQALIEGLEQFSFRLGKLQWLGYGYTVASLREVISAYMALERSVTDLQARPDADAMMKKTAGVIRSVYERITIAKGAVETGDFMLKAYSTVALAVTAYPGIAGLLSKG